MSQWLHEMKPFNFHIGKKGRELKAGRREYIKHVSFGSIVLLYLNCIQTISHDDTL